LGLLIEIDGPIHETQKSYDKARDKILNALGYNILRLKNEQIKDKPGNILKILSDFISQLKKEYEAGDK